MEQIQNVGGFLTPHAYESITVGAAAVGFTAANYEVTTNKAARDLGKVRLIIATVETNPIRYTVHGVDPTAGAIGHLAAVGATLTFANYQAMKQFRAIRDGGADGALKVTFYR